MTLRSSDLQSDSDLDSIRNSCDVLKAKSKRAQLQSDIALDTSIKPILWSLSPWVHCIISSLKSYLWWKIWRTSDKCVWMRECNKKMLLRQFFCFSNQYVLAHWLYQRWRKNNQFIQCNPNRETHKTSLLANMRLLALCLSKDFQINIAKPVEVAYCPTN